MSIIWDLWEEWGKGMSRWEQANPGAGRSVLEAQEEKYLSLLQNNRGKEGWESAQVDRTRRICGAWGVAPTITKGLTHVSQRGCSLASRKKGNPTDLQWWRSSPSQESKRAQRTDESPLSFQDICRPNLPPSEWSSGRRWGRRIFFPARWDFLSPVRQETKICTCTDRQKQSIV